MRNIWLLALALSVAVAATAATARADEVVTPVAAQPIAWGEAADDLQLGVRFDDKFRNYRVGETAQFYLFARNVGKKAVKFKYFTPLFPSPFGFDEKGNALTKSLKSPPPLGYPLGEGTLSLAPGAQTKLEQTEIRIGAPVMPTLFWALDAAPGKYRVGFGASFVFGQKAKRAPLHLKSGLLALELTADSPPRAHIYENTYTWGRAVNGLQLGIRLKAPGQVIPATKPVPLGTLVRFSLAVRNVSNAPIKVDWFEWRWSINPRVTPETGEQRLIGTDGGAHSGQVFRGTKTLDAEEGMNFGRAWLFVGVPTDKEYSDPVLRVEPGRYRVRYDYDFTPDYHAKSAVKDPKSGLIIVPRKDDADMPASEIILEVAPADAPLVKSIASGQK